MLFLETKIRENCLQLQIRNLTLKNKSIHRIWRGQTYWHQLIKQSENK